MDEEMSILEAGWNAGFAEPWDGSQAAMMGAVWDAMRKASIETRTVEEVCRSLMTKIYNRGHSGLDLDCPLCQAYIAADRLLSFETAAPLSDEVLSWDRRLTPPPSGEL